ncbi:2-C-methyl-D-erythritol 4-phosphate cytidylyltransferase [Gilvimarinus agarilyticus]|uniref:IspD/TarI family cytidylyltransferase n=1 Tax=Gilvimarinus sp. 2_MG-2023 TaxID=3062666 RepID=UPI001C0A4D49|nr:2-C-methyl-D-erythritol 4-phosphate cytidylyltransferase [Gilvimarinus sp. 2_MG-2023]MBU2886035.1 2-C-methyl-D-erythritol 4-phosphate cytidylyltransferase [Gilvimarinus agarilyticus]MDO6570781.1 2-C-methyl-D-erythritol 4-phosphate cytidylyltransferase [Gilvimarinus sp. 2_MG-2023]
MKIDSNLKLAIFDLLVKINHLFTQKTTRKAHTNMMKKAALIPAAGQGLRLGEGPKALLKINGITLVEIVVSKVLPIVDEVIVAAPQGYEDVFNELLPPAVSVISGGDCRWSTVDKLIKASQAKTLLIQNAASPFASQQLIEKVILAAEETGAAGAFIQPSVPVGLLNHGKITEYAPKETALLFQTPQAFFRDILEKHHSVKERYQSTAQYVMAGGHSVESIQGEPDNFKITNELDWEIAKKIIAPKLANDLTLNRTIRSTESA